MAKFPITLIIIALALPAIAQTPADEPYRVTHPADRITCFSPGLEASPITS